MYICNWVTFATQKVPSYFLDATMLLNTYKKFECVVNPISTTWNVVWILQVLEAKRSGVE